jgi:hypothetical protein
VTTAARRERRVCENCVNQVGLLAIVCGMSGNRTDHPVWELRGWHNSQSLSQNIKLGAFHLSRADGADPPKWKDVEHKQDGKYRLGYNPATEDGEISIEDFEAVQAIAPKRNEKGGGLGFQRKGGDRAMLAKL